MATDQDGCCPQCGGSVCMVGGDPYLCCPEHSGSDPHTQLAHLMQMAGRDPHHSLPSVEFAGQKVCACGGAGGGTPVIHTPQPPAMTAMPQQMAAAPGAQMIAAPMQGMPMAGMPVAGMPVMTAPVMPVAMWVAMPFGAAPPEKKEGYKPPKNIPLEFHGILKELHQSASSQAREPEGVGAVCQKALKLILDDVPEANSPVQKTGFFAAFLGGSKPTTNKGRIKALLDKGRITRDMYEWGAKLPLDGADPHGAHGGHGHGHGSGSALINEKSKAENYARFVVALAHMVYDIHKKTSDHELPDFAEKPAGGPAHA